MPWVSWTLEESSGRQPPPLAPGGRVAGSGWPGWRRRHRSWGRLEDPDNYTRLARGLAEGRGFVWDGRPTAYRPPLYPLVLAPLVAVLPEGEPLGWGIAGLHAVLGAATVLLTARAARRWGWDRAGLLAAAIVALDPVLVAQSRMVMTETLDGALAVRPALLRSACPAAVGRPWEGWRWACRRLCRPSTLPAALLVAIAALVTGPGAWGQRLGRGAIVAAATIADARSVGVCGTLGVFGEPVWTTTHGGYTLALANNPIYYAEVLDGPPGAVWSGANQKRWFDAIGPTVAGLSEPAADRRLRSMALRLACERPRDFARASLARLGAVLEHRPGRRGLSRLASRWRRRSGRSRSGSPWSPACSHRSLWRWPRIAAPLMLVALSAVHAVYWTDMRMRAPLVPGHRPDRRRRARGRACGFLDTAACGSAITVIGECKKKIEKSRRILLFNFRGNVRLMTAALGGKPLVSRFGR